MVPPSSGCWNPVVTIVNLIENIEKWIGSHRESNFRQWSGLRLGQKPVKAMSASGCLGCVIGRGYPKIGCLRHDECPKNHRPDPCRWDPRPLLPSPEKATVRCLFDVFWSATDPSCYRKLEYNKGRQQCFDPYFEWQPAFFGTTPETIWKPERNFRRGEQSKNPEPKSRESGSDEIYEMLKCSWCIAGITIPDYPILWMNGWQILHFTPEGRTTGSLEKVVQVGSWNFDGDDWWWPDVLLQLCRFVNLWCFSSPQSSICYVSFFLGCSILEPWAIYLETLPSRRSHRCDLSHRCADCLWMLAPWRLPWWSRGCLQSMEGRPSLQRFLVPHVRRGEASRAQKGLCFSCFFGCFRMYAGRISKFPPDFFVPWGFSGPKEKALGDLSFSVTSQQVPRSIPRVLWRKASDGMWGAELMKVDREVPMGMMGCLQILLGGTVAW